MAKFSPPSPPAITCPDLSDPQYGSVSTTGNRVGDLANYECDSGFRLKGDLQRVCLSSGEWSGVPPTCARKFYVVVMYMCCRVLFFAGQTHTCMSVCTGHIAVYGGLSL